MPRRNWGCTLGAVYEPGYDALGPRGERYEVKYRSAGTLNVDVNSFDYLVFENLDDDYRLLGMWRISVAQASKLFTWREGFKRYQATQSKVKRVAERVR